MMFSNFYNYVVVYLTKIMYMTKNKLQNNNSIFNKNNYTKLKETLKSNWIIIYTCSLNEYTNKLTNCVRRTTQLKYLTIENISNINVLLLYYNYDDY